MLDWIVQFFKRNVFLLKRGRLSAVIREFKYLSYHLSLRIHGLDLRTESLEKMGLSAVNSNQYENSGGPDLEKVLDKQCITSEDRILDIGCGKGGALITMAKYPFKVVDGLDISENLLEIAKDNIQRMKINKCNLIKGDAKHFHDYENYNYFYFSHPFPCPVMQSVIANLIYSLDESSRKIKIIYSSPACDNVIIDSGRFRRIEMYEYSDQDAGVSISFDVYINSDTLGNTKETINYTL